MNKINFYKRYLFAKNILCKRILIKIGEKGENVVIFIEIYEKVIFFKFIFKSI